MKPSHTGWHHFFSSARYSLRGLKAAFHSEAAFRQEVGVCALLLPLAWWIGSNPLEWILLVGSCLLVLMMELLNSAMEAVVDRIGSEPHALSGRAKDLGSAVVMLSMILAGLTWGLLLWGRVGLGAGEA